MAELKYESVLELPRDDWKSALALRRARVAEDEWDYDHDEVIIMLQREPDELIAAMNADDAGEE